MAELDLTALEPEVKDGEWIRATLNAEMKRLGFDYRDDLRVNPGIEQLCRTRIPRTPDKKTFIALDKHGAPMTGAHPLRRLAQELAAALEAEQEPTVEEITAAKRTDGLYQL